jgi:N-acetylneuraminic acid mutarotase
MTSIRAFPLVLGMAMLVAACQGATANVSGVVSAACGAVIEGASVSIGGETATTGTDGRFELRDLPVGSTTIVASAPGFNALSESIRLVEGNRVQDIELTPSATATVSGVVTSTTGAVIEGATVDLGGASATTGTDGRFEIQDQLVRSVTISASASGFAPRSESVCLSEGTSTHDVVLAPAGQWGLRADLLVPLSELAFAAWDGKIYMMGGYPESRVTARTVQVYDMATDMWSLGPQLPQPNNHGTAAAVDGKIYLIGGQFRADDPPGTDSYVNTVYELDPAVGEWVTKAPMPTARSSGVAVVLDGRIYVAGGRPPHEQDFAVYDPSTDTWDVLPALPTPRNHFTGAAIDGRVHYVGGRQGLGLGTSMTAAHEVFDPQTETWTTAAPMLRARSGMNGVMARGCFHVWGGEGPEGMFPDHDFYDPRTGEWIELIDMPIPVHGVYGSAFVDGLIWVSGGGDHVGGSFGTTHNQTYRPEVSCE